MKKCVQVNLGVVLGTVNEMGEIDRTKSMNTSSITTFYEGTSGAYFW